MPRAARSARVFGLGSLVTGHARVRGLAPAVVDTEGRLDFATLNRRVNRVANGLVAAGVGHGDRVAVRLPNGHRYLECLFGCAKIGAVLVPIDQALVQDEVDHVVSDSGAAVLLDGPSDFDELAEPAGAEEPDAPAGLDDDSLLLMYTSGTTGRPKGVVLTHHNVLFSSLNQLLGWRLSGSDYACVVAPFHHVGGLIVMGLPCLHAGGAVCIAAPEPRAVLETVERERPTALFLPPRLWRRVSELPDLEGVELGSVRVCASGGDPIPSGALRRLQSAFAAEFTDAYGLTEAASCSTILPGADIPRKPGSAGLPCAHVILRVLGPSSEELGPGEVGEIVQAGPTVMHGYWRRPDETAEALRDGWLHTGDLGTIDEEGYLFMAGRSKDMIVSGGAKVYPAEVERLLREHPSVADAAVIGIPDPDLGEAVAAVVLSDDPALEPEDVLAFCRGRIAEYKCPRVAFLSESCPRNASGKILKTDLRALYGAPM